MKIWDWINNRRQRGEQRRHYAWLGLVVFLSPCLFADGQLLWKTNTLVSDLPITALSVQEDFYFTNIGPTTIYLSKAYSTCGCTSVIEWPSRTIPPGTAGKVIVKLDISGEIGNLIKTIYISTDHSDYMLNAVITIPDIATLSTQTLNFERTNIIEQSVIYSNLLQNPISILTPTYDCEIGKPVKCTIKTVVPGRVFALQIMPPRSDKPYNISFDTVIQPEGTSLMKHYRFQANVN